jgi:uncharacterized membrane protein YhaH (DUF805 family)
MDDQQRAPLAPRLSTAQPPPVSPLDAMRRFWGKAFTYSGRATRAEYNWALGLFLIYYCIVVAAVIGAGLRNSSLGVGVAFALMLVFMLPWLALIARRCHDINRPGTFGLLLLATGIGFLITEGFLMFSDSDPRGARFDSPSTPSE